MSSRYLIAFALILAHGQIFPVLGQSTIQEGYDIGDSSISIIAEIQQMRLLNEQVQGLHKLQSASLQQMTSQHDIIMRSLQAVDRRLQEHDISIKNQTDINTRILQAVDRRLQEHDVSIKNQIDINTKSLQAVDRRLQEHDTYIKNQTQNSRKLANNVCGPASPVRDCSDIRASGQTASGVYEVSVRHQLTRIYTEAYCDMETPHRPSLVLQRRKDGSVDFFRTWSEYKAGFGDLNGEFWLGNELLSMICWPSNKLYKGNEMLYLLTSKRNYKLRIDLEDFEGNKRYAEYARFSINSSADNYRIAASGYFGNAGDSLTIHNGQQFTTKDVNNDNGGSNCALKYRAAWWYKSCYNSNLNGIYHRGNYSGKANYAEGIAWSSWLGIWYSLQATEMKLIPAA